MKISCITSNSGHVKYLTGRQMLCVFEGVEWYGTFDSLLRQNKFSYDVGNMLKLWVFLFMFNSINLCICVLKIFTMLYFFETLLFLLIKQIIHNYVSRITLPFYVPQNLSRSATIISTTSWLVMVGQIEMVEGSLLRKKLMVKLCISRNFIKDLILALWTSLIICLYILHILIISIKT